MTDFQFSKSLIIGVGLIGSSLARALRDYKVSSKIYGLDTDSEVLLKCQTLNILTNGKKNIEDFSVQVDLIILCSPLGTYKKIFSSINDLSLIHI